MQHPNATRNVKALFSLPKLHRLMSFFVRKKYLDRIYHLVLVRFWSTYGYGAMTKASKAIRVYRPYLIYEIISV